MKKAHLTLLLPVAVLIFSCATNKPMGPATRELEKAAVCCAGYENFDFQPLKFESTQDITIDTSSPVFSFDSGKSYFKAFRLPVQSRSYFIVVSSHFVDKDNLSRSPYVFSPVIMLLDAEYRVTRKLEQGVVKPIPSGNSMNHASIEFDIKVNPRTANERFMVIYTTAALLNEMTALNVLKTTLVGQVVETHYPIQNAPVGKIQILTAPWIE